MSVYIITTPANTHSAADSLSLREADSGRDFHQAFSRSCLLVLHLVTGESTGPAGASAMVGFSSSCHDADTVCHPGFWVLGKKAQSSAFVALSRKLSFQHSTCHVGERQYTESRQNLSEDTPYRIHLYSTTNERHSRCNSYQNADNGGYIHQGPSHKWKPTF